MKFKFWILKLIGRYNLLKTKSISNKIFVGPNVQFIGLKNIEIKENCNIGENSLFIINNRHDNEKKLRIDKNVYIGRNNFITVGNSVTIKDYCIIGDNCSILGASKITDSPLIPYFLSGINCEKKIYLGVNCWLGNNVSIIGNVKIGHGSILGANTIVTKDIPPFSMVVGNPARIIKTFNFETNNWEKDFNNQNNTKYLDEKEYLNFLNTNSGNIPLAFYSASSKLGHL